MPRKRTTEQQELTEQQETALGLLLEGKGQAEAAAEVGKPTGSTSSVGVKKGWERDALFEIL